MKKIIYLSLALLSIGTFTQCTKPTKDFSFSVNPNPFDYTLNLNFYDAATPGTPPPNVTLTISGKDADAVYDISGVKQYKVVSGLTSLGLLYKNDPTQGNPATFTIKASAPGYLDAIIPVTIKVGQPVKLINVSMINLTNPPAGVNVQQTTTPLTNGNTTSNVVIPPPASAAPGDQVVTIEIPSGTGFKDESGNVLTGGTLSSTVVSFGSTTASSLNAFPGGTSSDNIKDQNGNTVSGLFRTGGFANITMAVGSTQVKTFTNPITLHMGVSSSQINPATGNLFQAGDQIPVWSYQTSTGQWSYEKIGTVSIGANGLEVNFTTTHLTYYNLAVMENVCSNASIVFNTNLPSAETFLVDVYEANDPNIPVIAGFLVQAANGQTVAFDNVPTASDLKVKVYRNTVANSQTNFAVRDGSPIGTYTGALCGGGSSINCVVPQSQTINFNIQGQCPSSSMNPIVRPTVGVFYRQAGSNSAYQFLGQVNQGYFSTSNLSLNNTYDFKVIWQANSVYLKTRVVDSANYQRTVVVPDDQIAVFCN